MTHNIIKTDNYLLVVDDSEIKVYGYITDNYKVWKWNDDSSLLGRKKVICHLPLNNAPTLEGVPLLPPLEDEVDSWITNTIGNLKDEHTKKTAAISLKGGYNKAKEKYKYTEENILIIRNKLVSMLPKGDVSAWDMIVAASKYTIWFDNYIQHLQQPKYPVGFECEVITMNKGYNEESDYPYQQCDIPKTTTNSQGQTVLVGTYKYE
jgi:hypothetical protein